MKSTPSKEQLRALSDDKAELLALLIEERSRKAQQSEIVPRLRDGPINRRQPLSLAQQRLWFVDQLEEGSAAYNIPLALRLRGPLRVTELVQALNAVVQRHATLRTKFVHENGEVHQEIAPEGNFPLRVIDLSACEDADREAELQRNQAEEVQTGFSLHSSPLVRGRLIKLSNEDHMLLVTMHHMVSDGWSVAIFFTELSTLYRSFCTGRSFVLPPLQIQYTDYVTWQRDWLNGGILDNQLVYWRARLDGAAPQLDLPTDRPRTSKRSYRGGYVPLVLDSLTTSELKSLAQRQGITLFMVLFAGWAILLSRISRQDDLVVGTPIANRSKPELETLIGLFVNTLPLRVQVSSDVRLEDFLEEVKELTLDAYEHQDVPFEKIVEAVRPQRSLVRNPIFQVMCTFRTAPTGPLELPELTATFEDAVDEPAKFDLTLWLEEKGEQISGTVSYAADLFEHETVERWVAYLRVLLSGMPKNLKSAVATLRMIPDAEKCEILGLLAKVECVPPPEKLLHELFEAQVLRTPDAIAVTFEGRSVTYAALNGRANQLARYLKKRGVGPDQLVAIYVDRSVEMVVGVLAILKAGGAYVPLDVNYPADRITYILNDADPRILLTGERHRERLLHSTAEVIDVDNDWREIGNEDYNNLDRAQAKQHYAQLAYVIYTSGSTGNPKGVMIEHRNVTRLFAETEKWFGFTERDVWTLFHSVAFDFSVWELWGAFLYGGRIVIVPYLTACSPLDFYKLICEESVTVLNQVPSAFAQLVVAQPDSPEMQHSLRVVIFGGESLDARSVSRWVSRNGVHSPLLVNMYGITETTVHVTYHVLAERDLESERSSVVGEPIPDLRVYLLDQYRQLVPIGVAGEIFVGGAGVARGYLNRPELTAERFIGDPLSSEPGMRLYKSGDVGRWRPDLKLEYLGRSDDQVKVRGYRIELGEIEAQLARHARVKEVAVVVREDLRGEKRLVAYMTQQRGDEANIEEFREFLSKLLPDYMIPSAFVILAQLPLTASGKVNRRALPAPDTGAYARQEYEAPQGELEEELTRVWTELLNVERIGRKDDFFALGGHSLLATRVITRINKLFEIDLPLRVLFEKPTIEALSRHVLQKFAAEV